ncbi:hypothetical protein JAAARDRAFT_198672 [Jaapia argillacea MUCL 33604]|uniref:glutaminase n=1 Tax=Jaapia argillacea MUCL 33604 TaxID=933084 RepID=A0A067PAT6_9AGAM|nr:hypothetical protein JAAARDRAFT_198672 [Jaapia argillacea MUCL 33604]
MSNGHAGRNVVIGILALQGAFAEHQAMLQKISSCKCKIVITLVRTVDDLAKCDALVIPGGESTTIALLARLAGLLEPLRDFLKRKPVWGTCAGAILLAQSVENTKKGGQELLGGMSIAIARNGWGSQVESFEVPLEVEGLREPERPFTGIFIRAPVVLSLDPSPSDPPLQVIARLSPHCLPQAVAQDLSDEDPTDPRDPRTVVALRQGLHLLTTFHPELTKDNRFHDYFVHQCVLPTLD